MEESNVLAYKVDSTLRLLESQETLRFLQINNDSGLQDTLKGQQSDFDLVSGVYEGGLKIWECSLDLVDYVFANRSLVAGKRVFELGCG